MTGNFFPLFLELCLLWDVSDCLLLLWDGEQGGRGCVPMATVVARGPEIAEWGREWRGGEYYGLYVAR